MYPAEFNPFVPNAPFLYPLNTLENIKVFRRSQGAENGCTGNKWFKETVSVGPKSFENLQSLDSPTYLDGFCK